MNADEVETDVIRRIRDAIGKNGRIELNDELYHDLRLMGDDAEELLVGIMRDYGISFEGFRFQEYFPSETSASWHCLMLWLGLRDRTRKSFAVNHLIAIIQRRAWFVSEKP